MKIALICPSNMLYMPYVTNYEKILKKLNVDYTIISWNRFNIEEHVDGLIYKDKKLGHQRNYLDYFKYKNFVKAKLKETNYDKVIVFTLQLGYFLKNYLIKNYEGKYILDIRDYNKIFKFSNFKKLIDYSAFTVISSPGYQQNWLPESAKYVVNHNSSVSNLNSLRPLNIEKEIRKINISTIGVIRHWDVNVCLVNKLNNLNEFNVIFHGEGTINEKLKNYVEQNKINNVKIYGRYKKEEEEHLYKKATIINTLLYDNHINCKSLLTNRLYNSALYGKPMLSLKGTYLAEQIQKYNLGLVLNSLDDVAGEINRYLKEFSKIEYEKGRVSFFENVIKDNEYFIAKLNKFIGKK
ncbi:hypothetical protein [Pseudalkalibacillus berkeleyi]|uniref:Glycosyltransferase involved in cell wall biosynthesis n=1 Tax=Pseudalkalibacillus berkeleyi TaxID=1069813 RepID=A0ABS9H408_9BACL|nr:hypothetical protein [Pseudalkalibacillus berkeleyi]MCF6138821.1 hypothetical protein [Pseudalkalibacillus berkeleyi]